ncbi:testis-specific serine/threonine-protein kinase 1-like protein [Dinothrombium tinctorium]|uniref:Testis-specific serine/threonine-protein kinase 1-like protein n=1 Tax=Dinothrombium tinctorium TaxID=1965070 RepID=A0A3S3P8F8_9ACAR|nr:testis-specific serine/threonine-protein kinase 1-like protein [Dinothrombium tinctorium]RWS10119.1 testis-specific serine/threonine-protein kinase 1-like protein [Dinothrombium tinctorium]
MRQKQEELRKKIEQRQQAENEEWEPSAIKEKGYVLVGEGILLGRGTFSEVYQMRRGTTDVAAKVIELENVDESYKEKFLPRQLNIIEQIDSKHKNIIAILDVFKTSKRVFIMMEYAAKGSIFEYINDNGPVGESQAKKWLVDICKGLNYMHTNDIAHRNIRTENLLLDVRLNVKLGGFSFTRLCIDPYKGKAVYSATNCGAAPYYAPEIIKGERYDPKAADTWSTCVVLFIVTNKKYPFDYRDYTVLMTQQQQQAWKNKLKVKLSEKLINLMSKMFDCNFKTRIKIRQILDDPCLDGIEGNKLRDRDEVADIREALKKAFISEGVESPTPSTFV